jgi:hypothetical protein
VCLNVQTHGACLASAMQRTGLELSYLRLYTQVSDQDATDRAELDAVKEKNQSLGTPATIAGRS